jgi:hypothetical protein
VIVGFGFGFLVTSINDITLWIVSALWGGYTASNVLKWYWWRLNGHGYFWGMMTGIAASLILPRLFPSMPALMAFPYILVISFVGCIIGSLTTEPEPDAVLMRFYMQVRPWGFWKPILTKVNRYYPDFERNKNFTRVIFNVIVGIIWQTSIVIIPIALVTQEHLIFTIALCSVLLMSIILKFTWWNNLDAASKETLPADFDERVLGKVSVQTLVSSPVAESVSFSK